jgi:prepilin-type N-terminal cleavage/methylation domain-containing protein
MFWKSFIHARRCRGGRGTNRGFSLLELMFVIGISVTVAAMAIPYFLTAYYDIRLKAACSDLSGLMQRARLQSARQNAIYTVGYQRPNVQEAFIDLNNDGTWEAGEPIIDFNQSIVMATGVPAGVGAPPPYVLVGDTAGVVYTNTTILGYSQRGLPCAYIVGVCSTPAAGYFVYYVKDRRPGSTGWGAVVVSRSGRTKTAIWNGAAWQ